MNHRHGVERSIEALAARQFGVFAREQALELGVSRRVIERRIASGAWPLVRPGIHRIAAVSATRRQAIMAVSLWSAPGGLVSHLPAARVWGFDGDMANALHVTIDRSRRLRAADVVVHRVSNLLPADRARCGPVNVTSPLRTAVDLAAVVDVGTLEVAIESALRRRLFTRGQLRWRAEALMGTGRAGSAALRRLLELRAAGRSESAPEVRVARLLAIAGLGEPVRQHEIRGDGRLVARVDLAYPAARLVIEYDSDAWHTGVTRRHQDADRRNRLRALGWTVVEVTPATLRDPGSFVALVRSLLAAS